MEIGKIVKSNTHIDYVCQIYGPGEAIEQPAPIDYTFGTFVSIDLEQNGWPRGQLIGIVYNTLLLNPDFGALGPRLSPRQEVEVFAPDYLAETATLVGIIAVGWQAADDGYHQGVPAQAATVNGKVYRLDEESIHKFHSTAAGLPSMRYVPILVNQGNPLISQLLMTVIDRLNVLFPQHQSQLNVMRENLAWKAIVEPVG